MSKGQNNNQQESTLSKSIKYTNGSAFQPESSTLEGTKNAPENDVARTVNITNKLTENA
jgi:hypothetical protein